VRKRYLQRDKRVSEEQIVACRKRAKHIISAVE
jgi:hypothetical protein